MFQPKTGFFLLRICLFRHVLSPNLFSLLKGSLRGSIYRVTPMKQVTINNYVRIRIPSENNFIGSRDSRFIGSDNIGIPTTSSDTPFFVFQI